MLGRGFAGLGRTGIGDNFARARLLLAQRAGYLPQNTQLPDSAAGATQLWHQASKGLSHDARAAGFPNPMAFLRQGVVNGGRIPRPLGSANATGNMPTSLITFNSQMAATPAAGTPFQPRF